MKKAFHVVMILMLGLASLSTAGEPNSADNKQVFEFFAKMDAYAKSLNVAGLMSGYSPDTILTMKMKTPQGIREQKLNKKMLEQMLKQNFSVTKSYSISREFSSISRDSVTGSVIVEDITEEKALLPQGTAVSKSKNTFTLILSEGSFKISSHITELIEANMIPLP